MSDMPFCDHLSAMLDQLGDVVDGVLDDDQQIQREILEQALAEILAEQPLEVSTRVLVSLTSIAMIEISQGRDDECTDDHRRSVS